MFCPIESSHEILYLMFKGNQNETVLISALFVYHWDLVEIIGKFEGEGISWRGSDV